MGHQYPDKFVNDKKDMPSGKHWAIIEYSSVHIPGDQRSIDCPGHGYPAHNEAIVKYKAYLTEEKWLEQIEYMETEDRSTNYTALIVNPVKVNKKVSVRVV